MKFNHSTFEVTGEDLRLRKVHDHLDEHGIMTSPSLHDGAFLGVLLSGSSNQERIATLHARSSQGQPVSLTLHGVKQLAAQDFYEGNIICTVWAWTLDEMPTEFWNVLMKNRLHSHKLQLERARMIAAHPQALGFAISSSYGCELAAVCDSFWVQTELEAL